MKTKYLFFLVLIAVVALGFLSSTAFASEAIYLCKPCSRDFIPEANSVIEELGLTDQVKIKTTSCLGYCDQPVVLKFRNQIYTNMNREKLKMLLTDAFDL
jgi:hypothetical protein